MGANQQTGPPDDQPDWLTGRLVGWLTAPMLLTLVALAKAVATPAPVPLPADACAALIPPKLAEVVLRENPGFQLPRSTDASAERLQRIENSGDWPCSYVAAGDFDGNGSLDRAILLKSTSATAVRVVAALNIDGSWQLTLSQEWAIPMESAYLKPVEPGLYQRPKSTAAPAAELDKAAPLESDRPGFEAGEEKGRSVVFFFQDAGWQRAEMEGS